MKKMLKEMKWQALTRGVMYVVLGIVALVIPDTMVKTLGYLMGILLIVGGALSMISYLLRDAHENYYHEGFTYGLIGIVVGIVVLYRVEFVISLVPFVLGILVLLSACSKLQDVIDMKRLDYGNWVLMLVLAAVNLLLGILLICNPFEAVTMMFRVLGVGLLFSGITDCVTTVYFARKIGDYMKSREDVTGSYEEITRE